MSKIHFGIAPCQTVRQFKDTHITRNYLDVTCSHCKNRNRSKETDRIVRLARKHNKAILLISEVINYDTECSEKNCHETALYVIAELFRCLRHTKRSIHTWQLSAFLTNSRGELMSYCTDCNAVKNLQAAYFDKKAHVYKNVSQMAKVWNMVPTDHYKCWRYLSPEKELSSSNLLELIKNNVLIELQNEVINYCIVHQVSETDFIQDYKDIQIKIIGSNYSRYLDLNKFKIDDYSKMFIETDEFQFQKFNNSFRTWTNFDFLYSSCNIDDALVFMIDIHFNNNYYKSVALAEFRMLHKDEIYIFIEVSERKLKIIKLSDLEKDGPKSSKKIGHEKVSSKEFSINNERYININAVVSSNEKRKELFKIPEVIN